MCLGCKDPFITFLKTIGYNAIRLPRADVRPLQVLVRSGKDLQWLGDLPQLFVGGASVPTTKADEVAADVSGERSGELSLGVGLSLLGSLIGAMGGGKLGLDVAYKGAKSITFEFADVLRDSVSIIDLDKYLGDADIDPSLVTVQQMLEADSVHVITAAIKSKKFGVESKQSSGTTFDVDVPVIKGVVGGNVKVGASSQKAAKLTYEGPTPLVFGFQAVQLFYDKGRYTTLKPTTGVAAKAALSGIPDDGRERFVSDGSFATLRM
jgi:hypothetical protein